MSFLSNKLKIARGLIGHTQDNAARESGLMQKDVSLLENGKKEFIPNEYILYLKKHKIDLNSIFDEAIQLPSLISVEKNALSPTIENEKSTHFDANFAPSGGGEVGSSVELQKKSKPNSAKNVSPSVSPTQLNTEKEVCSKCEGYVFLVEVLKSQLKDKERLINMLEEQLNGYKSAEATHSGHSQKRRA